VNWSSVASLVADLTEHPLFVVDESGDIRLVNEPLEKLIGLSRERLIGTALSRMVPRARRDAFATMLASAMQGARRRGEVPITTASGDQMVLTVELAVVLGEDARGLVLRVLARHVEAPPFPDAWMEIRIDDQFGLVQRVAGTEQGDSVGRHCYEVVADRGDRCPDCPVGELPIGGAIADIQVVDAERTFARRAMRVSAHCAFVAHTQLSAGVPERLLSARIDLLAARGGLSLREREVLGELIAGRSLEEIGQMLSISARTVRFHQANILDKLGVESRLELFTLLVA
jgi:PAS domain S-box-containing protein